MTERTQTESSPDIATRWPQEMRWLLACARHAPEPATTVPFDLPSAGTDWDLLVREAERHGISGMLYHYLSNIPGIKVPAECLSKLEAMHRLTVQRGLRFTAVLIELIELLQANNLRVLPYKGPVLSAQIFGDSAVREAADLDILLPEDDAISAYQLLRNLGFEPIRYYSPAVTGQLFRYRSEIGLIRNDVLLELQWRIAPKYFSLNLDTNSLIARSTTISVGGFRFPVMSPEDTLLVLCIHGAKHHWHMLKWILDIDLFIRRTPQLSWNLVVELATKCGTLRMLLASLHISNQLLLTPLPAEIEMHIREDTWVQTLQGTRLEELIAGDDKPEFQRHLFMLQLRERKRDRFFYMLRLSYQPTESEWEWIRLPSGFQWLYYLVRAGRVLAKAAGLPFS